MGPKWAAETFKQNLVGRTEEALSTAADCTDGE